MSGVLLSRKVFLLTSAEIFSYHCDDLEESQAGFEVGHVCAGASMLRCLMTFSPKGSECQRLYNMLSGEGQL